VSQSKGSKSRLDHAVVALQLAESGTQAQALIRAGQVRVNGQVVAQPSHQVTPHQDTITVAASLPFVSRGGFKLQQAITRFGLAVEDQVCLDVGASTGGFTDCLLQHGAQQVYAVDVGYGQLDWRLRNDPRVVVHERFNIRNATPDLFNPPPSLAVVDVSFISLKKVLPTVAGLLTPHGTVLPQMVTLVKPQFEYGDYFSRQGFRGVVRGDDVLAALLAKVLPDVQILLPGWQLAGLDSSPITGPKGNREFLAWWQRLPQGQTAGEVPPGWIQSAIEASHQADGAEGKPTAPIEP
jgi:23S rRNA (cytidine1920-2'-O)/16S rRNA (cytidine1409-2'-O)-methyltransferase